MIIFTIRLSSKGKGFIALCPLFTKQNISFRADLQQRVKAYNRYHEGSPSSSLKSREVNGRLVLEGSLKIHWSVKCAIHLKPKDDSAPPTPKAWRKSYKQAIDNGCDDIINKVSKENIISFL